MAPYRTLAATFMAATALDAEAACSKALVMATEPWPPYVITDPGKTGGLDIELAKAIVSEAGCELVVSDIMPTVRRMMMFQRGSFDLMLAASDIPERRGFARFTLPYRHETVSLFALASRSAKLRAAEGLEGVVSGKYKLLVPRIGWYGKQYALVRPQLLQQARLYDYATLAQGMQMLKAGRADFLMADQAAVSYAANHAGIQVERMPKVVYSAPVSLMLSKASTTEADVEQLNGAIARLEKSGALQAIRERYGLR
jgi:polar amino acid transport system substrate-binding protein